MTWKWWPRTHKYIDENKERIKRQARKEIPFLLAFGNEQDVIEKAKIWNPAITPEQLEVVIKRFRAAKFEREHERVR